MWINKLTLMMPPIMQTALNMISYLGAALIALYVIISLNRVISESSQKRTEDIYFARVCNIIVIRMVLIIFYFFMPYFPEEIRTVLFSPFFLYPMFMVMDFLKILFPLTFLVFLDYFVYKSEKRIKNKYRFALAPYIALISLWIAIEYMKSVEAEKVDKILAEGGTFVFQKLASILNLMILLLYLGYFIYAFLIVRIYYKEMKQPLFLRLDRFAIPWALGLILTVITGINLGEIFDSIALLLIYLALEKRDRFLKPGSEFYNEAFIPYFEKYCSKKRINGGCAIYCLSEGNDKELGDVLWKYRIPKSVMISMDRGGYLILSDAKDKRVPNVYEMLVEDVAKQEADINVKISSWISEKKENNSEFARRVFSELGDTKSFNVEGSLK